MEDKILKFHPDTVAAVRKLNNMERQEERDQMVDSLRDWLKKQHHLTKKEYSREYLERSIILTKGSVEKTKSQIDKLCSLRTLLPKFFVDYDARNRYESMKGVLMVTLLPQLTEDHYRIYLIKVFGDGITKKRFFDCVSFGILFCEYVRKYDYINGIVVVLDYRDVNIKEYMASINFAELQQFITIVVNGYGLRIKGIHCITSSKTLKSVIEVIKKMFGTKMISRFHIHDDVTTLYEHVPKKILPLELGGEERSQVKLFEEWKDVLSTKTNIEFFKEMSQAISNESSRMKEELNVLDLGLAGTFRSLTVD